MDKQARYIHNFEATHARYKYNFEATQVRYIYILIFSSAPETWNYGSVMDKKALLLCLVQYAEGFNKDKGEHELVFRLYLKMYKHIAISKHVHCLYICV